MELNRDKVETSGTELGLAEQGEGTVELNWDKVETSKTELGLAE